MKVFIDTNVALDFLMRRKDFYEESRTVMALGYNGYCSPQENERRFIMHSFSFSPQKNIN